MRDVLPGPDTQTPGATMNPLCKEFEAPQDGSGNNRGAGPGGEPAPRPQGPATTPGMAS